MTRDEYGYFTRISTRWADCDSYGHVNNAQYYSFFDTALTTMLIERGVLRSQDSHAIGLCVESQCRFRASLDFPTTIDAGVRIGKLGEKSIRFEIGLFDESSQVIAADGYFVHVYVDPVTRKPVPLTAIQREAVSDLIRAESPSQST